MKDTRNASGMLNARFGRYGGKEYLFTHRDPKTGDIWSDDIPVGKQEFGKWVSSDSVVFI